MAKHRATRAASAMAFDLFLASIPMLALTGWLLAVLVRHGLADELGVVTSALNVTPTEVRQLALRHLGRFSGAAVAPVAIAGSLWLASSAFHTLMSVFELAVHAAPRPWWRKRLLAVVCVIVAILALGIVVAAGVAIMGGPTTLVQRLALGEAPHLKGAVSIALTLACFTLLLAGFFRVAVMRPGIKRRVWPGSILAVGMGAVISAAFAYYAQWIARFTVFYGGLTAVAITLLWLWLICATLLVGAELNAQLEGEDPDRPMVASGRPTKPSQLVI